MHGECTEMKANTTGKPEPSSATHQIPSQSWLSPNVIVKASGIEGSGLFAASRIEAGEIVISLGGELIDDAALRALEPPYSSLVLDDDLNLLMDSSHPAKYGNHSCDPTLWHLDSTTIVARRTVEMGEELTIDYGTHTLVEWWSMTCLCGTAICRGSIGGGDWRLEHLQRAYGDHWAAPLLRRIQFR